MTARVDSDALVAAMPFAHACGISFVSAQPDEVRGRLEWAPDRCTIGGLLHGGALMTLADSVGGVCAFLNLPPGAGTSTIESKTNFLQPVKGGHVGAVARPVHVGRTVIVVETDVTDDDARLVAKVLQSQAVLTP